MNIVFVFLLLTTSVFAIDKSDVPQIVVDAILHAECLRDKDGMYEPNFIRINRLKDVKKAKKNGIAVKGHIVRCGNPEKCSKMTAALLSIGIKNLDLGPYQQNYYYQNYRWKDKDDYSKYFNLEKAEMRTREILAELITKYGYSWRTLGRYHHFDPKHRERNRRYYSRLYEYIYGAKPPKFYSFK